MRWGEWNIIAKRLSRDRWKRERTMELTREDQFRTGPSEGDTEKKDTAEARLERLLSRTLPSTQSVTILCHVVRIKKRCIFAGRSDGVVVFWKPASSRHTEGFDLKESHLLGHKGGVMCISFAPHFANNGLLFNFKFTNL